MWTRSASLWPWASLIVWCGGGHYASLDSPQDSSDEALLRRLMSKSKRHRRPHLLIHPRRMRKGVMRRFDMTYLRFGLHQRIRSSISDESEEDDEEEEEDDDS